MKHPIIKTLCIAVVFSLLLTLASCKKKDTADPTEAVSATRDQATADESAHHQTATVDEATALPTDQNGNTIITYSATQAPTVADPQEVLKSGSSDPNNTYDASGFVSVTDVIPDALLDIRYSGSHNFVGTPVNGYEEPLALLSKEAAAALINVSNDLREQGYVIKIFDAYRPQRAVNHFVSWANDWSDTAMKNEFYPELDKSVLFSYGYIAYNSGHSRGSTIDLTIADAQTGEEIDMGGSFDYFGSLSHPDYTGISSQQYQNRMILRQAMINNGFSPLSTEWWHFSLNNEPYPYTYFDFPVSSASLSGSRQ